MLQSFVTFINEQQLFKKKNAILLAVSGGMDSMAMAHLFKMANYNFGLAHCNFQLRGEAADKDEQLVIDTAKHWQIPYYHTRFNTEKIAKIEKKSIQLAARSLRYDWLEQIRSEHQYDYIATAHHLNDSLETLIYNLAKGCGIKGLHGIPLKSGKIIRPLLFADRQTIELFVKKHSISYREDTSNASTKYKRNLIRHKVIPILKEINPSLEQTFAETLKNIQGTEAIYNSTIETLKKELTHIKKDTTFIHKDKLTHLPHRHAVLYELIADLGFNNTQIQQILLHKDNVGAIFYTSNHILLIDRTFLIIQQKINNKENCVKVKNIPEKVNINKQTLLFSFCDKKNINYTSPSIAYLDYEKMYLPLTVRYWRQGDRFQPLGMKGKSKKLQDFFSNQKLNRFEKEKTLIIESREKICWVVGHRIDERFKITESTNTCLKIEFKES